MFLSEIILILFMGFMLKDRLQILFLILSEVKRIN